MENRKSFSTLRLVQLAILTAIMLVLSFTPLGYLRVGMMSISFLTLPVAVGAVLLGPKAALFLGAVFGASSFVQCFGMDPTGVALMGISPIKTFITCVVPRLLVGILPALLYRALERKNGSAATVAACLTAPVVNTVLFLGCLVVFFGNEPLIAGLGDSVWAILMALGLANLALEAPVCVVIGTAVCLALKRAVRPARRNDGAGR